MARFKIEKKVDLQNKMEFCKDKSRQKFLLWEQGGRKQIFYGGARLNKKNEIMKILQILEIFTK